MRNRILKYSAGILGIFISVGLVWYIAKSFDVKQSWDTIKSIHVGYFFAMVLVYLSTFYFRTMRWRLMLLNIEDVKFSILIKSMFFGFAGNNLIPARGGELLRMEYFSKKSKIGRTTSLTSIVLEKILDASVLLVFLLCASLILQLKNEALSNTIKIASLIFLPVIIVLLGLRVKGKAIINWTASKEHPVFKFITSKLSDFYLALVFLKPNSNTIQILGLSFFIWLIEALVFMIGIKSIGIEHSIFPIGIIALCIVNFGILIPSSPGYIGVFQAAILIALGSFGISETDSLAAAIIIHSSQFFPVTIIGLFLFLYEYFRKQQNVLGEAT